VYEFLGEQVLWGVNAKLVIRAFMGLKSKLRLLLLKELKPEQK